VNSRKTRSWLGLFDPAYQISGYRLVTGRDHLYIVADISFTIYSHSLIHNFQQQTQQHKIITRIYTYMVILHTLCILSPITVARWSKTNDQICCIGTQKFNTASIEAALERILFIFHPRDLRSILMASSYRLLGLPNAYISTGFN
jgi:hypothetical protein